MIKLEDNQEALNENVEIENNTTESPPVEETTEEAVEPNDQGEAEETEEGSKKGYTQRVRELNEAKKKAEARAESLEHKLKGLTSSEETPPFKETQYEPVIQPGEEIDATELDRRLRERESRILKQADALVTLRGKQQEAINRINSEATEAIQAYPELNPDSESYNEKLSNAITKATVALVKENPYSSSVKSIVKELMEPYKGAVSKEVGNMKESIVKQVSEAALRPTSIREKEKPASALTIAELEARLGVHQA